MPGVVVRTVRQIGNDEVASRFPDQRGIEVGGGIGDHVPHGVAGPTCLPSGFRRRSGGPLGRLRNGRSPPTAGRWENDICWLGARARCPRGGRRRIRARADPRTPSRTCRGPSAGREGGRRCAGRLVRRRRWPGRRRPRPRALRGRRGFTASSRQVLGPAPRVAQPKSAPRPLSPPRFAGGRRRLGAPLGTAGAERRGSPCPSERSSRPPCL